MKDFSMTLTEQIQALVDKSNDRLTKLINDAKKIESLTCKAAENGEASLDDVSLASEYVGRLYMAKAAAASGHGAFMGIISVKSGGS
jgi:hypothetical protein